MDGHYQVNKILKWANDETTIKQFDNHGNAIFANELDVDSIAELLSYLDEVSLLKNPAIGDLSVVFWLEPSEIYLDELSLKNNMNFSAFPKIEMFSKEDPWNPYVDDRCIKIENPFKGADAPNVGYFYACFYSEYGECYWRWIAAIPNTLLETLPKT